MTDDNDNLDQNGDMLALESQLCFALYAAQLSMSKLYRRLLKRLDITYPQYLVMLVLWEEDHLTVSGIGERLSLDSATLTPLLKRLEGVELVRRARSREDERQVEVSLTDKGHALREQARALPIEAQRATGCSEPEMKALRDQLNDLKRHLDSI
ncbi:MarR family winged helix-turn-helix transcriptional regulator [Kushneria indalinina]|uniref:DNA-binding MarR family transcriptional regulator n=1 Tax=Kushneria indalinina DSM 14324 TaxID=1122140 RepID=A0A3D9DXJ5_9GAMM|nr:MarR family transcriptional regulator [Kushneria indalinina]REC95014.1 DNA-binding MarR family transcriptional regulator [Kushneria indalinina DSM 14324]